MEHHLLALVLRVHAVLASLTELGVKTTPVARVLGQHHSFAHCVKQLVQGGRVRTVSKQGLFRRLTHALVDQPKLEIVDKHMLIIVEQELTGLRAKYRLKRSESELGTNRLGESDWGGLLQLVPCHQLVRSAAGQPQDDSDVVACGPSLSQ